MATELEDFDLLGHISEGDLVAMEAKYHFDCLTSFRNRYRSLTIQKITESRAFLELLEHIEKRVETGTHIFKLSEPIRKSWHAKTNQ